MRDPRKQASPPARPTYRYRFPNRRLRAAMSEDGEDIYYIIESLKGYKDIEETKFIIPVELALHIGHMARFLNNKRRKESKEYKRESKMILSVVFGSIAIALIVPILIRIFGG